MDDMESEAPPTGAKTQQAAMKSGAAQLDPQMIEAAQLMIARCRTALANDSEGVDAALQADPVQATVVNGVRAVRGIAQAAEKAGRPMPFQVLVIAGLQIIKDLAGIALEKGYIEEADLQTFLKECTQQSLRRYTAEDLEDGTLSQEDFEAVRGKLGQAGAQAAGQGAGPAPGSLAAAGKGV